MLNGKHPRVRPLLLNGEFGLEKESLRVDSQGFLVHTKHPFTDDKHIVKDFCENQTEINTSVAYSAEDVVAQLDEQYIRLQKKLAAMSEPEYLWPFSNPPYIRNEEDIPVACFEGGQIGKRMYREYLSEKYGRYKMTFSGIHLNFSFAQDLLQEDFRISDYEDFSEYKNQLYTTLAERAVVFGWLMVAVTAASPVMDSSFVEKGQYGKDVFNGMASVRCSEMGYWNFFSPVLNYKDVDGYADSIQKYVEDSWLKYPSELYYPIRLKPAGENTLQNLRENGVNHIELRMFDLNPLTFSGVDVRDVKFAQIFLVWLACLPPQTFHECDQIQSVQNYKNAAHYDLKTVKIVTLDGKTCTVADAALQIISAMQEFYQEFPEEVQEILNFEKEKFIAQENRYAWKVREQYGENFVKNGILLAKKLQQEAMER